MESVRPGGGGRRQVGADRPVTEDSVALMRLLSGRSDECALVTDGDPAVTPAVRAARVVF